eukprot:TRINITY_DN15635_c0_g1_i1.p1 TRINITY_DN15635_c0_g1~~TRINITY_DN15635_c0_g1_i1.p1  ORF type:complete len:416 (-),score=87.04 TRINITY_DN15635_c0_g1_i1:9-1235(-)
MLLRVGCNMARTGRLTNFGALKVQRAVHSSAFIRAREVPLGTGYREAVVPSNLETTIEGEEDLQSALNMWKDFADDFTEEQVEESNHTFQVVATNAAGKFDLHKLSLYFRKYSLTISGLRKRKRDKDAPFASLSITKDHSIPASDPLSPSFLVWKGKDRQYFWFDDGVIVAWGVDSQDLASLDNASQYFAIDKLEVQQTERMNYAFADQPGVDKELDKLYITKQDQFQEMSLFSVGLARSCKLEEVENEVEKIVSEVHQEKFLPIKMDYKRGALECRNKLSNIYQLEYKITSNRFQSQPGFLWDCPNSTSNLFAEQCAYLDIEHRLAIATERLDLPRSYWELENDHFKHKNSWRLEEIIILGIFIEIVLTILSKSKNWEEMTLEDLFGKFYENLKKVFGGQLLKGKFN